MTEYTHYHSKFFAHRIMLEGRNDEAFAKSLSTARVDMKPHQVEAARFALHSPVSKGVILADEVGLGKTIEACLVIAQKWAERRRHVLLIVPASLRTQWQQELQQKFSLPSVILDSKTYREAVRGGQKHPFDNPAAIVITSYEHAARQHEELQHVGWDLVVIDEAHRLRNVYKKGQSGRAKKLRDVLASRFKILLTATPLQNSLIEVYGLVSVIDDSFFGDEQSFRTMYGRASDRLSLQGLRRRLSPIYKRHLRRDVLKAGHVRYTERIAVTFDFNPPDLEAKLYDSVSDYLQRKDSIAFGSKPNQLVLIGARKTLGSSIAAITQFLQNVIARLRRNHVADESVVADIDDMAEVGAEIADDAALSVEESDNGTDDAGATDKPGAIDPKVLAAEIAELEGYVELARSIGPSSKGNMLLRKLPEVLDAVEKLGGKRKAVIFTESVRTQRYLAEILSEHGYAGQIALMNGSNSDLESQKIYKAWKKEKEGTDAFSGSKGADMKSAIVNAFKSDDKAILIATESGAEGINLQFCSLVINFDLPWNPQRIEQRIGRCHRYGQAIDVTVVNMLNLKNQAEKRIHELLSSKFHLFQGVFGASDQVLGSIESGIDFEKKVLAVVQSCRPGVEIDAAFKKLETELEDQIKADMTETRQQLFDNFDKSISDMLKQRDADIRHGMSEFERRLWLVARAELPEATFHSEDIPHFEHDGRIWSTAWPLADEKGWQFFRLGDDTLADRLVETARARDLQETKLVFDYKAYRADGQPRLSDLERVAGKAGWLKVSLLRAETALGSRESIVVAAATDDGKVLAQETAERLFQVPAVASAVNIAYPADRMATIDGEAMKAAQQEAENESRKWLDEETVKLEAYADDLESANKRRAKELHAEAEAAKRSLRGNQSIPLAEKIEEERRIKKLEQERDDLVFDSFKRLREIRSEIDDKLNDVAAKLAITPKITPLMTIRWELVV
ncbi:DEAD/DEAH box helicase [Mesorhizobium sp. B3-1-7]|uniref:SNF2-related protein n=1 Tax=Mesorhizobium sp. B3-1-7 TaxID=2589894 RepID=UPI00112B3F01|nr:SNF2-related protein [Mesorhizobium sp. B3-1-7]TPI58238.1 DEAD/DEAH box helicase [Mesorhizobium sp. B3-1-7]